MSYRQEIVGGDFLLAHLVHFLQYAMTNSSLSQSLFRLCLDERQTETRQFQTAAALMHKAVTYNAGTCFSKFKFKSELGN